jgi:cold shock protein
MPTGKVKWFDPKKGYGFIIGEEGQDVFVHFTCIVGDGFRALKDGETVAYELTKGDKGYQARKVNRLGSPEAAAQSPAPQAPAAG